METALFIILALIIGGAAVYFILHSRRGSEGSEFEKRMEMMNENVANTLKIMLGELGATRKTVDERLKENAMRLDNASKVVGDVRKELGQLSEATNNMINIGKEISSLQNMMRAPKFRGQMGENFLENLLAQVFIEKKSYSLQYRFSSGEIADAVIHLRDGLMVAVDSKFPFENFKKMIAAQNEKDEKISLSARKLFASDVKKHIDDIAKKYILPGEGTLEFAIMYIPAENVYYETVIKNADTDANISEYALSKKVIPVSPNNFYVYLQTLLMGLRGLQIEKNAKEILDYLSHLQIDFGKFSEDFNLIGTHLSHAKNSYDDSCKRLEKFEDKLSSIGREHKSLASEKKQIEAKSKIA